MMQLHTIPLRDAWCVSLHKRAQKAMSIIKEYGKKHGSAKVAKIGPELNHAIWACGIKSPPRRIKVSMIEDKDEKEKTVWLELAGAAFSIPKKKEKEQKEKKAEKGEEAKESKAKAEEKKEKPAKHEKKEEAQAEKKEEKA